MKFNFIMIAATTKDIFAKIYVMNTKFWQEKRLFSTLYGDGHVVCHMSRVFEGVH